MGISQLISRQASVSLAIGLCVAGCAKPSASTSTTEPLAESAANRPIAPSLSPDGDPRQAAVIDTVGDTVDRFDQIIRQREQANLAAADVREMRSAQKASVDDALAGAAKSKAAPTESEASTIERLAAAVRAHKPIDAVPAPVAPVESRAASNSAIAVTDTPPAAGTAQAATLPPIDTSASGALASGTGVQIERHADTPDITRNAGGDPMLSLQQKFAGKVAADPRDLSAQLDLQLFRFLKDEPVPTMSDLTALPSEDRELISALCDALSNFRSTVRAEPNPLNSVKSRPFIDMADRIRTRADLTLSGLTLCTKVANFGVYDKIDPLVFTAGEAARFVLYCEVDGFLSQQTGNQNWETKLSLEVRLYDDHGLQVLMVPAESTKDSSLRRRRDFFLRKLIELPPNLASGHYLLKASVQDLQANRVAQQTIQFAVNPKEAVPR